MEILGWYLVILDFECLIQNCWNMPHPVVSATRSTTKTTKRSSSPRLSLNTQCMCTSVRDVWCRSKERSTLSWLVSVRIPVYPPACLSICLPIYLPTYLPACLPSCLQDRLHSYLPSCLPACLLVHLSYDYPPAGLPTSLTSYLWPIPSIQSHLCISCNLELFSHIWLEGVFFFTKTHSVLLILLTNQFFSPHRLVQEDSHCVWGCRVRDGVCQLPEC